jgi:transcriptional regulator with XRE-family HTH domain
MVVCFSIEVLNTKHMEYNQLNFEATRPGMPFADSAIAKYLTTKIDALQGVKSQRDIASEIGYDKANMISMFKRGEARVPLDKILPLANSLRVDPAHLFKLALEQYWPDQLDMISKIFGQIHTENEGRILLTPWREITDNSDPAPDDRISAWRDKAFGSFLKTEEAIFLNPWWCLCVALNNAWLTFLIGEHGVVAAS